MNSKHRWISLSAVLSIAASLLIETIASGAAIQWGAPQTIGSDNDVVTTGSLEFAYNLGGTGTAASTVNGEPFAPFIVTGSNSSAAFGRLTLSTFNPQDPSPIPLFGSTAQGSSNPPFSLLSSNYKALLSTSVLTGNTIVSLNASISGLTIGRSYTIELWSNNASTNSGTFNLNFPAVTLDPNSTNANGGVGQYVLGTFVANASSQSFLFSTGSATIHFNAIQLRTAAVPEPSSFALMALCALPFAFLRHRQLAMTLDASH